jgi:hypothetical protein
MISAVDFEGLRKGKFSIFFFIEQAPDVHVAAIAAKLPDRLASNQAFITELTGSPSTLSPTHLVSPSPLSKVCSSETELNAVLAFT